MCVAKVKIENYPMRKHAVYFGEFVVGCGVVRVSSVAGGERTSPSIHVAIIFFICGFPRNNRRYLKISLYIFIQPVTESISKTLLDFERQLHNHHSAKIQEKYH